MIDLTKKGLPDRVYIDGKPFYIRTDFREWLKYHEIINTDYYDIRDVAYLFKGEHPYNGYAQALFDFYANPNSTPHGNGTSSEIVFDYKQDGEYIYASFMQAYNIDLTECDMHWHKFLALFRSLPDNCKMARIMQDRAYHKETRSYEQVARARKEAWSLSYVPEQTAEELEKINNEINEEFYATL